MYLIDRLIVRPKPGNSAHLGIMKAGDRSLICAVGRAGIGVNKKEGDGKTPIGTFRLVAAYFRADRVVRPQSLLAFSSVNLEDGWCDAPSNPNYNQPVKLPFADGHERMFRDDHLYDVCVVLDYNLHPRRKNRGSAIFFHLQTPDRGPTEGCIALGAADMMRLLPRLSSEVIMEIRAS